jgi:multisubunit Na+/H+ antiporter MnhB subunit
MQFFPLMNFQYWILAVFLGLILLILVYLAFGSHGRRTESAAETDEREILFGEEPVKKAMPPILVVVFLGAIFFALGYFILIGIQGPPF